MNSDTIPKGVEFSDKFVIVPGPQQRLFTQSGGVKENLLESRYGQWIERGDVIGEVFIDAPKSSFPYLRHIAGRTRYAATIRSPVSGLVLVSSYNTTVDWIESEDDRRYDKETPYQLTILLPKGEKAPEGPAYLFSDICRMARKNRHAFAVHSPYWGLGPIDDELFQDLCRKQERWVCAKLPPNKNLIGHVRDLLSYHRDLYPYIRHLINDD